MAPVQLEDAEAVDVALEAPRFLLFKHSHRCGISRHAFSEYTAFAASHPLTTSASAADQPGWQASIITETEWDGGVELLNNGMVTLSSTDLGPFSSFFGSDERVNYYFTNEVGNLVLSEANDEFNNFVFSVPAPASEFLALDMSGAIVDRSAESAIPEPATFGSLVLGLALLGAGRRWRSSHRR